MPIVNTIKQALKDFSDQKAIVIRTCGCDTAVYPNNDRKTTSAILLIFDNVQHFLKQHDLHIGWQNSMMIGIAATYVELEVQAATCDVMDKRRCIVENKCKDLTVDQILGLVDQLHFKIVGVLQWLEALTKEYSQTCLLQIQSLPLLSNLCCQVTYANWKVYDIANYYNMDWYKFKCLYDVLSVGAHNLQLLPLYWALVLSMNV
jgi:hypothetical protein